MRSLVCPHCKSCFKTSSPNKKYCSSDCQIITSRTNEWEKVKKNPLKRCRQLCSMAKNRSKTKDIEFNIDTDYLYSLWMEQDGRCCISGLKFDLSRPEKYNDTRFNAPSLDRIIPEKGYTKGNVRLVIYQINAAMQQYGLEHFLSLCKTVTVQQEIV